MSWFIVGVGLLLSVPAWYLGALTVLSFRTPRRARRTTPSPVPTIAVLVPAHDEGSVIQSSVRSLQTLCTPSGVTVHVVADNCSDGTAELARRAGACVHVRTDPVRTGKGAALNWLVAEVSREDPTADTLVLVDADTRVSPGFLSAIRDALAEGADVVQVLNLADTSLGDAIAWMREIIFRLVCHVRPLAYAALGSSAGMHGNGVAIRAHIAREWGWDELSVVEDVDLHLRLAAAGVRVTLAPDGAVRSLMPNELHGAYHQTVRWERGKVDLARRAITLLGRGLACRDVNMITSALDVLMPPFTVVSAAAFAAAALGALTGNEQTLIAGASACLGVLAYLSRGIQLARPPRRALIAAIALLPRYLAWKAHLLAAVLGGAGRGVWTRTKRNESASSASPALLGSEVES
jgi:1,2-diacylglycerol 3-beta-glucosyltransferase